MGKTLENKIGALEWGPISDEAWDAVQDEGLDEEKDVFDRSSWQSTNWPIPVEDAAALRAFDEGAIEKYNAFDLELKEAFGLEIIDLINYDTGKITLVRTIKT